MFTFFSNWRRLVNLGPPFLKRVPRRSNRPLAIRPGLRVEALEGRVLLSHGPTDHIHPKLSIVIEGQPVTISENIGITQTRHYSPHTHDTTGQLHVGEAPQAGLGNQSRLTTLKDFFDVWRETGQGTPANNPNAVFSRTQIMDRRAGPTGTIRMTVNGQPNTQFENYSPHDQDQIVISFERVAPPATPGVLEFSAAGLTVAETAGTATITVNRTGGAGGTVTVAYATSDGVGLAGVHYVAASGTLTFAEGETTKTFPVSIRNNGLTDGITRTVGLTLSNPTGGATLNTASRAVLSITPVPPTPPPPPPPPPIDPAQARTFVTQVYRDVLQREAEPAGMAGWTSQLTQGVSQTDVLLAIQNSEECRAMDVKEAYRTLLGREADATELRNRVATYVSGQGTLEQVKAAILSSEEYFQSYSGGNDAGFLDTLYRNALNRPIDAAARASFTQAMASGTTRGQIADIIFRSDEYREKLAQSYYQRFLNRAADPSGLNYWANVALRAGARDEQVITGFLTSEEYRNRRR